MQGREYEKEKGSLEQNELDSSNQESNNQLADALAMYFERKNSGEKMDMRAFVQEWPAIKTELDQVLRLVVLPERAAQLQPNTQAAWQRFKGEVFSLQTVSQTSSLGNYVAQALVSDDRELKNSGLPRTTLEALSHDPTPLSEFQNYKFDDYAQLAKRYGIKNDLFPRVLKWFKGLSKSLHLNSGPAFGNAGMLFAREENRNRELSESELAQALDPETKAEKEDA